MTTPSTSFSPTSPNVSATSRTKTSLSQSPGRSPSRVYGSIALQPSPPPPGQQPRRSILSVGPLLEPEMMDFYGSQPAQPIVTPPLSSKMVMPVAPSPLDVVSVPMMTEGLPGRVSPLLLQTSSSSSFHDREPAGPSPLQQLPVLRSCTFYALRIIYFPKTVFVKTVALGRGCASRMGLSSSPSRGRRQQQNHQSRNNSYQGRGRESGEPHYRSQSEPGYGGPPPERRWPWRSGSRSRSRSPARSSTQATTTTTTANKETSRWKEFLNSYHVQVGMICLCVTGESIAQSVICPFLYYMVRDFHVGLDIWIGYYAGLLLTGYWGANLCTTLVWGHLSGKRKEYNFWEAIKKKDDATNDRLYCLELVLDKYGRKAVLLFGLFMTSLSTVYLGLATCYHDAMWALVFQGACTGLIPVSKCAIGEIANRQQRIHDAQMSSLPRHRHHQRPPSYEARVQQDFVGNEKIDMEGEEREACSNPECDAEETVRERLQPREDYAAKGYSGLVIAVAIGAACKTYDFIFLEADPI